MKLKKMVPWILSGVMTITMLGLGPVTVASAAEQKQQHMQEMTKDGQHNMGQMDPKMMQDMMKDGKMMMDPVMHQQCMEMMQKPEMQDKVKEMLAMPQMQASLKAIMQKDGQFHKMISDLVNSVEMTEEHAHRVEASPDAEKIAHNQHH